LKPKQKYIYNKISMAVRHFQTIYILGVKPQKQEKEKKKVKKKNLCVLNYLCWH